MTALGEGKALLRRSATGLLQSEMTTLLHCLLTPTCRPLDYLIFTNNGVATWKNKT